MPPASNQATRERPGKRRAKRACRSHKILLCISKGSLHTARIIQRFAVARPSPSRALEPSDYALRGSPNSAFEAGNRLLQYMVALVSEDAPNGSTVAFPLQPFFAQNENIS